MTHTTPAPALSTVPARALLAVDGEGAPQDAPFAKAVRALFAVRAALGARDDAAAGGHLRPGRRPPAPSTLGASARLALDPRRARPRTAAPPTP